MVKLGDVCTINPKSPGFQDELTVSFVPMPKVGENGEFDPSEIKTYQEVKKGCTFFQNGDVLFAKITPCMENGKGAIAQSLENGVGFGSTEFYVLRPHSEYVTSKWLFYLLSWEAFRKKAEKSMTGSAGQKRVSKNFLTEYVVNIPDLSTQEKMTDALDKVCHLISLRKQQLAKLDELVKTRFVEMFGDIPKTKYIALREICSIITDGTHQPPKFVESGIPFLFVSNIVGDAITYHAEKFITEETYARLIKRTPIEVGDILLSTVGSYGHPAVVKSSKKFCFQRHIAYLKPKGELVDSIYLHRALLSENVQRQIEERVKGIAQKTLNLSEIKIIQIPLPPLDRQKEFAVFSNNIDKAMLTIRQSLDKLMTLKKSLMQKYF